MRGSSSFTDLSLIDKKHITKVSRNVELPALIDGPAFQIAEPQLISKLGDRCGRSVCWMDVYSFGPTVQEEKPTHDGAQSSHSLRKNTEY